MQENHLISKHQHAYHARSGALASWAWTRCVNRIDAWGGYNNPEDRGKVFTRNDGTQDKISASVTRPAKDKRGSRFLKQWHLKLHFGATEPRHVVGLHTTSPDNTSLWGAVELDHHGPLSNLPAVNLRAALAWYDALLEIEFMPLLTDSNGVGGYHLRFFLSSPIATFRVFHFLKELTSNHIRLGLPNAPEIFPKQAGIQPGGFGNWLRLPGRHHTRDHWSTVWAGHRWLEGPDAIDFILRCEGDAVDLVPRCEPPEQRQRCSRQSRPILHVPDDRLGQRIASYLAKCPNLCEGQGRDDVAYHAACFLIRDLQLSDEDALDWLSTWDRYNSPPKGEDRLREIIHSAHQYGQMPYGSGLHADRHHYRTISVNV